MASPEEPVLSWPPSEGMFRGLLHRSHFKNFSRGVPFWIKCYKAPKGKSPSEEFRKEETKSKYVFNWHWTNANLPWNNKISSFLALSLMFAHSQYMVVYEKWFLAMFKSSLFNEICIKELLNFEIVEYVSCFDRWYSKLAPCCYTWKNDDTLLPGFGAWRCFSNSLFA